MEGAEMMHPPRAASLVQGRTKAPTVYWDAPMMVAFVSLMMIFFICGAICFLGYKVYTQDADDCEDDLELEERPGSALLPAF